MFEKKKEELRNNLKDIIEKNIEQITAKAENLSITIIVSAALTIGYFAGALSTAIIYGTSRR